MMSDEPQIVEPPRVVEPPPTEWSAQVRCCKCDALLSVTDLHVKAEGFKRPGTYFFDGSADAAGIIQRAYVKCPLHGCGELTFVDGYEMDSGLARWRSANVPPLPMGLRLSLGMA